MVTRLTTLFPTADYSRLANPYKIEENPETFLRKGWGLGIGSAINSKRQISCHLSLRRELSVTLTREYFSLEEDPVAKSDTEKLILEDHFSLMKDFEKNPVVNGSSFLTEYVSDSGIQYVYTEREVFLMLRTTFTTEYMENLT